MRALSLLVRKDIEIINYLTADILVPVEKEQ